MSKHKDYGEIYAIFKGIKEDAAKAIVTAYSKDKPTSYTALDAVIALAKSDGLTDDEVNRLIMQADWCPRRREQ